MQCGGHYVTCNPGSKPPRATKGRPPPAPRNAPPDRVVLRGVAPWRLLLCGLLAGLFATVLSVGLCRRREWDQMTLLHIFKRADRPRECERRTCRAAPWRLQPGHGAGGAVHQTGRGAPCAYNCAQRVRRSSGNGPRAAMTAPPHRSFGAAGPTTQCRRSPAPVHAPATHLPRAAPPARRSAARAHRGPARWRRGSFGYADVELPELGRTFSFPYRGSGLLFARSTGVKVWEGAFALAKFIAGGQAALQQGDREVRPLSCGGAGTLLGACPPARLPASQPPAAPPLVASGRAPTALSASPATPRPPLAPGAVPVAGQARGRAGLRPGPRLHGGGAPGRAGARLGPGACPGAELQTRRHGAAAGPAARAACGAGWGRTHPDPAPGPRPRPTSRLCNLNPAPLSGSRRRRPAPPPGPPRPAATPAATRPLRWWPPTATWTW
jgi:hypothetical protein